MDTYQSVEQCIFFGGEYSKSLPHLSSHIDDECNHDECESDCESQNYPLWKWDDVSFRGADAGLSFFRTGRRQGVSMKFTGRVGAV